MLEEPPPGAVFLAASDQLDAVLHHPVPLHIAAGTGSNACAGNGLAARCRSRSSESRLAEAGGAPVGIDDERRSDDRSALDPAVRESIIKLLIRGPG